MPSISTRTGDDGTTGLIFGQRVPKNHPRVEAVGRLDELNAALGMAKASARLTPRSRRWRTSSGNSSLIMGELSAADADQERYLADRRFGSLDAEALARLDDAVHAAGKRRSAVALRRVGHAGPHAAGRRAGPRPRHRPARRAAPRGHARGRAASCVRWCSSTSTGPAICSGSWRVRRNNRLRRDEAAGNLPFTSQCLRRGAGRQREMPRAHELAARF